MERQAGWYWVLTYIRQTMAPRYFDGKKWWTGDPKTPEGGKWVRTPDKILRRIPYPLRRAAAPGEEKTK